MASPRPAMAAMDALQAVQAFRESREPLRASRDNTTRFIALQNLYTPQT